MMTSLREVNVDNNRVGWYQSCFLGTFNSVKLIANLAAYHESIPNRYRIKVSVAMSSFYPSFIFYPHLPTHSSPSFPPCLFLPFV